MHLCNIRMPYCPNGNFICMCIPGLCLCFYESVKWKHGGINKCRLALSYCIKTNTLFIIAHSASGMYTSMYLCTQCTSFLFKKKNKQFLLHRFINNMVQNVQLRIVRASLNRSNAMYVTMFAKLWFTN